MPRADTVWPVPLDELLAELTRAGLRVRWWQEWTDAHLATVDSLLLAYDTAATGVPDGASRGALDELVTSHRLWGRWLRSGRVRKLALVVEALGRGPGDDAGRLMPEGD